MQLTLTLYSREYCSLCGNMSQALEPWQKRYGFNVEVVDVDADPVLEARYDELVPVLADGDTEICHWFLDEQALAAYLAEIS